MRGAGGEAGDELFFLGEHLLLLAVRGDVLIAADLTLAKIKFVIAAVSRDRFVAHFNDPSDDAVHELAIVARHDERAFVILQPLLEPDDRLEIQMVGRLVHEKNVGLKHENFRQRDSHFPTAAERFNGTLVLARADPETGQNLFRAGVEVITAALLDTRAGFRRIDPTPAAISSSDIGFSAES